MCWNADVSLNTFVFSSFVLSLIIYNNYYTKYKIHELNNIYVYLFFASFIFIQLIEFFIWKNINNEFYNNIFSTCATLLLIIQPIASIMLIKNIKLRNKLLFCYLSLAIPFSLYSFSTENVSSLISEGGHLRWKFFEQNMTMLISIIWLCFFLFPVIYEKKYVGIMFGLITLFITFINYKKGHAMWSMWCWSVNSIMIYYAFYLLIYLPFLEKKQIC